MLFWIRKKPFTLHFWPHRPSQTLGNEVSPGHEAIPGSSIALSDGVGSAGTPQLCHCSSPRADQRPEALPWCP